MTAPRAATRLVSIDVLRTTAIVLMTVVHFVENLAGSYDIESGPFIGANRYWWMPTGFAAPLFTFLSGVSYRLWADAQAARGRDTDEISKITVRRGLFLILFGFAFNVLVWMPEDVFNWDILTLIGTAMLALDVARRTAPAVPAVACGLLVGLAPTLRAVADYRASWAEGFYDYEFTLGEVVLGYFATGYFPVFPWLALPLAGFLAAPLIYGRHDHRGPAAASGRGASRATVTRGRLRVGPGADPARPCRCRRQHSDSESVSESVWQQWQAGAAGPPASRRHPSHAAACRRCTGSCRKGGGPGVEPAIRVSGSLAGRPR